MIEAITAWVLLLASVVLGVVCALGFMGYFSRNPLDDPDYGLEDQFRIDE